MQSVRMMVERRAYWVRIVIHREIVLMPEDKVRTMNVIHQSTLTWGTSSANSSSSLKLLIRFPFPCSAFDRRLGFSSSSLSDSPPLMISSMKLLFSLGSLLRRCFLSCLFLFLSSPGRTVRCLNVSFPLRLLVGGGLPFAAAAALLLDAEPLLEVSSSSSSSSSSPASAIAANSAARLLSIIPSYYYLISLLSHPTKRYPLVAYIVIPVYLTIQLLAWEFERLAGRRKYDDRHICGTKYR